MADDLRFNPGDNYLLDDISGFKIRRSKARLQWDNIATSGSRWSPRQPQDLVQAVRDEQYVSLSRPRQQNRFTILGTSVTAPSAAGSTSLTVQSTVGFQRDYHQWGYNLKRDNGHKLDKEEVEDEFRTNNLAAEDTCSRRGKF